MKNGKIALLIVFVLIFASLLNACGGNTGNEETTAPLSLDTFSDVFYNAGASVDAQPEYEQFGAKNACGFSLNGSKIKVYEFASENELEAAVAEHEELAGLTKNGLFLLDSSDESVINIFNEQAPGVTSKPQEAETLSVPGSITSANAEISVKSAVFANEVLPDAANDESKRFELSEGYVYIDIDVSIKNISQSILMCDMLMSISVEYEDTEYTSFSVVEDSEQGFKNSSTSTIPPGETAEMRFVIKCPQGIESARGKCFAVINTISGLSYKIQVKS